MAIVSNWTVHITPGISWWQFKLCNLITLSYLHQWEYQLANATENNKTKYFKALTVCCEKNTVNERAKRGSFEHSLKFWARMMKFEGSKQIWSRRMNEQRLAFLELLSELKMWVTFHLKSQGLIILRCNSEQRLYLSRPLTGWLMWLTYQLSSEPVFPGGRSLAPSSLLTNVLIYQPGLISSVRAALTRIFYKYLIEF